MNQKISRERSVPETTEELETLKEAYRLWSASNGEQYQAWLDLMDDGFENGCLEDGAPGLEFTRQRRGKEEMAEYFHQLHKDWLMICHFADEFLQDGDRIVVLIRTTWQNRKTGKIVDSPAAHVWRFKRGKAVKKFEFADSSAWKEAVRP